MLPQSRYMHLSEANIFGVIVADVEGVIYEANDAFLNMIGYSREEVIGGDVRWQQLTPPEDQEREAQAARNMIELGKGGPWEKLYLRKDGTCFPALVSGVIIDKEKIHAMAFIVDLTEQKRLEEKHRQLLIREQEARAEAAEAKELAQRVLNQRMDEFISIASHELRNPITTIRGLLQLAQWRLRGVIQQTTNTQPLSETPSLSSSPAPTLTSTLCAVQDLLQRAEHQILVQNRLVGDLLDSTRVQANRLELHTDATDLVLLMRQAVEDQRRNNPSRLITLQLPLEEGTFMIVVDADRITQVVTNYLTNALKYSPEEQPVQVMLEVDEQKREVRVCVTDRGPGLSAEDQRRIWERFYRVPGVVARPGTPSGLGLGLHICRAIIEQHNGRVGVKSVQGQGSKFWFALPLPVEA